MDSGTPGGPAGPSVGTAPELRTAKAAGPSRSRRLFRGLLGQVHFRGVLHAGHVVVADHHGIADADEIRQDGLLAEYGVLLRLGAHADADDSRRVVDREGRLSPASAARFPRLAAPVPLVVRVREEPVSAVTVPVALASLGFSAAAVGFSALVAVADAEVEDRTRMLAACMAASWYFTSTVCPDFKMLPTDTPGLPSALAARVCVPPPGAITSVVLSMTNFID